VIDPEAAEALIAWITHDRACPILMLSRTFTIDHSKDEKHT
jgi:hypothetical protein